MSDVVRPSADAEKKRILVLADSHGRNISGILSYVLPRRQSEVLVIFKPNATLSCVAEDIDRLTTSFTMADVVVLIGGTNDLDRGTAAATALVSTIEDLQRRLQQRTQLIVATLPRRYDSRKYNALIDQLNGAIRALRGRYARMKILELGDMGKDYHTNQGLHLNVKGKLKLCLKLCKEMDALPRASILTPPVRKVADFLKLFTLPDGHRFNYESPREENNTTDETITPAVPQTQTEKFHRVRSFVIETRITVPASVGVVTSGNTISKAFKVFVCPSKKSERRQHGFNSIRKSLRTRTAKSFWVTGNTISVKLICLTNRSPNNVRMGTAKDVKINVTESKSETIFRVSDSGLILASNKDPAVIVIALEVEKFFNFNALKIDNGIYGFEESTVGVIFSKRMCELVLKIGAKVRLVNSAVVSYMVVNDNSGKDTTDRTTRSDPDGSLSSSLENETSRSAEDTRRIHPHAITLNVTFEEVPLVLSPDVAVFRPILIVSSHLFVTVFNSSGQVEVTHYAEFLLIKNALLVRYVRIPVFNYVVLSGCPKQSETFHSGFADPPRFVPHQIEETRSDKLYFVRRFTPERDSSLHIYQMGESSGENGRSDDDVIVTDSLVRLIKHSLLYLKMKKLATAVGKRARTCFKQTRKSRNGGVPEVTKQLTKVTTTYLSCCGDFNSATVVRRLKSGAAKVDVKERDPENQNSSI